MLSHCGSTQTAARSSVLADPPTPCPGIQQPTLGAERTPLRRCSDSMGALAAAAAVLDHMSALMDGQFIRPLGLAPAAQGEIYDRGVRPGVCSLPVYLLQVGAAALAAEPCKHQPQRKWPCCHFPDHCFEDAVELLAACVALLHALCTPADSVLWRVCIQRLALTAGEERTAGSQQPPHLTQVEAEEAETTGGGSRVSRRS